MNKKLIVVEARIFIKKKQITTSSDISDVEIH